MEDFSKLLSSIANLAWPAIIAALLYKLHEPLKNLIDSARGRKFTIKVAGNELTMEEASEQTRAIISDLVQKVSELENKIPKTAATIQAEMAASIRRTSQRILWIDDRPKNNSFIVAALEEQGVKIDIALSTNQGLELFSTNQYDAIISDMGRPEGDHAGIDLTKKVRKLNPVVPIFIYCGSWGARNLRDESLQAGATEITASSSTLLSLISSSQTK